MGAIQDAAGPARRRRVVESDLRPWRRQRPDRDSPVTVRRSMAMAVVASLSCATFALPSHGMFALCTRLVSALYCVAFGPGTVAATVAPDRA